MSPTTRTLDQIQAEFYPLMVAQIWGWIRNLNMDPAVIERALREACREELKWLDEQKLAPSQTERTS